MIDWTVIWVLYVILTLVWVIGWSVVIKSGPPLSFRQDRKLAAQMLLTTPIWPLWVISATLMALVYGLLVLIDIARGKS